MTKEHPFFQKLNLVEFNSLSLESILQKEGLKILFLWGYECPNCEIAKQSLSEEAEKVSKYPFQWYHCNVYEDFQVSTHFGLFGIPVFLFFKGSRALGRVTSYPGFEDFNSVLNKVWHEHRD